MPSDAGDLGLLQQLARGGKVLGLFKRPASARVTCSWGLPLSLEQFCVVLRLLAPINRHISGVTDYLVGMVPEGAFPTRLSVPLPVSFFVEASLRAFSTDPICPHSKHFASAENHRPSSAHSEGDAEAASAAISCTSRRHNDEVDEPIAYSGSARSGVREDGTGLRLRTASVSKESSHRGSAREVDTAADARNGPSSHRGSVTCTDGQTRAQLETIFDPPPEYDVIGEDAFLDEILDSFLSSMVTDGNHEVDGTPNVDHKEALHVRDSASA